MYAPSWIVFIRFDFKYMDILSDIMYKIYETYIGYNKVHYEISKRHKNKIRPPLDSPLKWEG